MARKNPTAAKHLRRKQSGKQSGIRSSLRNWLGITLVLLMAFAFSVSATLQNPIQSGGQQPGTRSSGVTPKRTPQRRDSSRPGTSSSGPQSKSGKGLSTGTEISNILSPTLAVADFDLLGLAVTVDPASLTVPKNTPTSIHTSVRVPEGTDPSSIIAALNPNYRVRGELTGPSLTVPLALEALIGQPLNIPPLSNAGDHLVRNLRVVDVSTPDQAVVTSVTPDSCGIVVIERLLISQVEVHELNYDEIIQAGINITDDSYQAFNFTLGIATTSTPQTINIPVAFPQVGVTDPRPVIGIPSVSGPGVDIPTVYPILLQPEGPDGEPSGTPPGGGEALPKIPGVIVFPGRVGFLHQFFEAIVIVGNGAPNGTPLVIHSLRAKAHLPDSGTPADTSDDPLRIAETQTGGRVVELDLHGLGPDNKYGTGDDTTSFSAGQFGQASFLLEGLKEGLHPISFDLEAMLEGLPSGPVKVSGTVPGAVLVRDASFAVTFTHPGVVRAGTQYDLGMTIYNSGQTDINGAFAQLPPNSISGAEFVGQDTGRRNFATNIPRGQSATVKWRLRASVTGEVTASYVKVGDGISAGLALVTGVGDRNIPLSPDSLILPEPVRHLPPNVVEAARGLLGQGWSIANAPAGSLPQGVTKVTKQTVVNRAVELGIAGMRVDFGEPVSVSLDTVLRDWLGELQDTPDPGFADAQRNTQSGYDWFDSIGAETFQRLNAGSSSISGLEFHREFANTELPRSRFISALVTQANGQPVAGVRFVDSHGKLVGFGAIADERDGDLAQGSSMRVAHTDVITGAVTDGGQMLVISNPIIDNWTLELNGWHTGIVDLSLVVPTTSQAYSQISWSGIHITQGGKYRVRFKPLSLNSLPILEEFREGSWQAASTTADSTTLNQPSPRVVGVIQVTPSVVAGGDKYGRLIGVLFSKPMLQDQAQTLSRYKIGGGVLKGSNPAQQVGDPINVTGAKIDYGNRFVFLKLDSTIGPYIDRDLTISSLADTRRLPLSPSPSTTTIGARVSPEGIPPGAYLTGRVVNADGTPVVHAPVITWAQECPDPSVIALPPPPTPIVLKYTDAQGRYEIDYVRDGDCAPLNVTVNNPTTHSEKRLTSAVAYDGQHMVLDMVFLARGNVEGNITSGGQPMPKAFVRVVPDLDVVGTKVVQADAAGHYVAKDVPVGNVSVLAVGEGTAHNASGFNAGTITGPGQTAFINVSLQNIAGAVSGHVFHADQTIAPGALVVAYEVIAGFHTTRSDGATAVGYAFADRDGSFRIENLPVGAVKLEVTDYVTGLIVTQNVQLTNSIPAVNGLVITLPGFGSVSGRVTDDVGTPLANVFVSSAGRGVQTDSLGNYTLQSLPAGVKTISAYDAATQRSGSAQATVTIGQTTNGTDIVIQRPSALQGTVYLVKEGTSAVVPAAGVKVSADGFVIVDTDAQGHYTIPRVQPGELLLRFVDPSKGYALNTSVKLAPGETLTRDATFRPGTIHGKVYQPDGVTPTLAQLSLYVPRPDMTQGFSWGLLSTDPPLSTQSAVDGSYSVSGVNPGTYRITTSNVFFPTRVSNGGTLPPGGNEETNLVLVSTLAGKIQGNVYQPDGTTLVGPGIRVTLSGGSLAEATVRTDDNGHYEFGEVFSAGGYQLTATDPVTGNMNRINVAVERNKDALFDLRLLGTGNLRVQVLDGAGQPATGGSVTIDGTDYPNVHRFAEVPVGSNGQVTFNNLPEGSYAISATRFGLGGRVSARVSLGSTVDVSVQLQATGNVEGHVYLPDGTTAISLADVQLSVGGRSVGFTVTSEEPDTGKFTFVNVPTGDFTLDAFDNHTGRVGRAAGTISTQGQIAIVNVSLLPVGAVSGQVTANGVGVDHASVRIYADGSGVRGANLFATTDPTGHYRFTGIPAGRFVISVADAPGGQTGSASGTVSGTVEPLPDTIVNISLEPSQTVTGTVFLFGGTERVPGAQVTITVAGRVFHTATNDQGIYSLGFVPLGAIIVRAEAPVGYDRGEAAPVTGFVAGGTVTANVTLAGVGIVSGEALDNNGAPLTSGTVAFTNDAWSPAIVLNASVQANGHFEIAGAPVGHFSLRLTVPGRVGVGSASGDVLPGQTTNLQLRLEAAATVTGLVQTADGAVPVQGATASVTLFRSSGSLTFYSHTNAQGIWTLNNVPLGTLDILVKDEVSGGVARAKNIALATNGQTVDVGAMLLDSTPITVASVVPANSASSLPTNGTVVTITFSEPAETSSVNTSTLQLQLNNSSIGAALTLSSDGRVATLTPPGRLVESATYKVFVSTQLEDRAGLRLATAFNSTFTTADETAPSVTTIVPANNATEIAPEASVVVTFNEPVDPSLSLANVIHVAAFDPPQTLLAGTYALDTAKRVATFTPSGAFADSARYTVTVNGQRDAGGNTQAQVFVSTFSTQDRIAPVIDPLPIDGTIVRQYKPTITATYHDNLSGIKTSSVVLTLDNIVVTQNATVTGSQVSYTPANPLTGGHHNITVRVADNAGNLSALRTAAFDIDDSGPAISSFTIGGAPAVDGMYVTSSLQPVFAVSYTDDTGVNVSATKLLFAPQGSTLVQVPATVTATSITYQPPALLAEGPYAVQAIITNNLGTSSTTGIINFTLDVDAPDITSVTPSTGSQHGGTTVTITGARLLSTNGAAPTVTIAGNTALVKTAVAGSPDVVTIMTPAGAPGAATIRMDTNRGTGVRTAGFTYQADPRTPFVVEPDTMLLWHMDETGNGAVRVLDVARYIHGNASSASTEQPGQFSRGRAKGNIFADQDNGALYFGSSGYTVEFWVKTDPVVNAHTLVGKDSPDGNSNSAEYGVRLLPSGLLRAFMEDTSRTVWKAELQPTVYKVDDNQWHYVAMVVNRTANRLSLYVDGIERASSAAAPSGFGAQLNAGQTLRAGHYSFSDGYGAAGSSPDFPGVLDEIRVSSTAHSAATIQKMYLGTEGSLGVVVTNSAPVTVVRGQVNEIPVKGYNLAGVTASITSATPDQITAQVMGSAATQARIQVTVSPTAALGDASLVLSSSAGSTMLPLRVVDLSYIAPAVEPDTRLLWHLDETTDGSSHIFDSGNLLIGGTPANASKAQPGRFGGGRQKANIYSDADPNGALYFGSSNYTVEFWMKTDPLVNAHTLVGKDGSDGYPTNTEYAVRLLTSGLLRVVLQDTNRTVWQAELQPNIYKVDDNQWHYVAMVVNRTANRLSLYVDGIERAFSSAPSGFGAQLNAGQPLRAGHYSYYDGYGAAGSSPDFPGILDEIRVSSTAHAAEHILNDATGNTALSVSSYDPKEFLRDQASGQPHVGAMTVNGFNLDGATAQVRQNGQPIDVIATVISGSFRQATLNIAVGATAPLGMAQLVFSKPGQPEASVDIRIGALAESVGDVDTLVLWHLNETGNGAVTILDDGPLSINGTATSTSISQPGHFGNGRAKAGIFSGPDYGSLTLGNNSFTAECWMKTGPLVSAYTLVGKDPGDGYPFNTDFALRIIPGGGARAYVFDTNKTQWKAEMSPLTFELDDNQWHHMAMVVDRTANRLIIYIDGVERASSPAPANFGATQNAGQPFRAGHYAYYDGYNGFTEFPGTLDDVRLSISAHSAERIARDLDSPPGLRIAGYAPKEVFRGSINSPASTSISLSGWGLDSVTARVLQNGQPIDAAATVVSSSFRQAQVSLSVQSTAPLGPAQLIISKPGLPDASVDLQINQQTEYAYDADTSVLWHLNETGNGAVTILDDGPLSINGTANTVSTVQPGHFGNGRAKAGIFSGPDYGALSLGSSSFTAECWMKTGPLVSAYTLAGKDPVDGYPFNTDFALRIIPGGGVRAYVYDTNKLEWKAEMVGHIYDQSSGRWQSSLEDNQWHHLAMVADRTANRLSIYVDGVERVSTSMPANFGAMQNAGQPFRAGHYAYYDGYNGFTEFPGTLDEVRLSTTAHTHEKIVASMQGTDVNRLNKIQPRYIQRATGPATVTFLGYGLTGATVTSDQPDVTVSVTSSSQTRLVCSVNVPATVPVGQLHFVVTNTSGQSFPAELTVISHAPFTNPAGTESLLLWHLDESGNGAVHINGSGDAVPTVIGGTANTGSTMQPGLFGNGRSKLAIVGEADNGAFSLGSTSFTAECWMKTGPLVSAYTLAGKDPVDGYPFNTDFALRIIPGGGVRGYVFDTNKTQWKAEMVGRIYNPSTGEWQTSLEDNQWHHLAMVVDRTSNRLIIYVDGLERANEAMPANFGAMQNAGQSFKAGHYAYYDGYNGITEFPGTLDEIRILNYPRTAAQMYDVWYGTSTGSPTTLIDPIADWSHTSSHSSNFTIEASGFASYFNGDDNRASRVDAAAGTVTWNYPGLISFEMITYHNNGYAHHDPIFETSADGNTWTTIVPAITSDGGSDGAWPRYYYRKSGLSGVNYIRATFAATGTDLGWTVKLTQMTLTAVSNGSANSATAGNTQMVAVPGQTVATVVPTPQSQLPITSVTPNLVTRDKSTPAPRVTSLTIAGAELAGVAARVMRDGQPLSSVVANVQDSSDTQVHLALSVAPATPLGAAQLVLSKPGYSDVAFEIRIVEPSEFALESDTIGLWHLDERDQGVAHLLDAGEHAISLTSAQASRAVEGRFSGGRTLARATADANNDALSLGSSSFTVEGWVKSSVLERDYVLIGKETNSGRNTDFTVKALSSGALRAEIYDGSGLVWQAETLPETGNLTDGQWHAVALAVDREAGLLSLYIDGQLHMVTPAPIGFAAMRNLGQPLEFGCFDADGSAVNGPEEFPGVLDEMRISLMAHKPEKIAEDFFGHDQAQLTLTRPAVVRKEAGPQELTLFGYGFAGATVTANQPGLTVTVLATTTTSIRVSIVLSDSVPASPTLLTVSDALGRNFNIGLTIAERLTGIQRGDQGAKPGNSVSRAGNVSGDEGDSDSRSAGVQVPRSRIKKSAGAVLRASRFTQDAKPVGGQR